MLIQYNCFDNALHILLKQNINVTVRKTANFRSLLELYQPGQVLIRFYYHTECSTKVRNYLTFKHQCAINELIMMKF